MKVLPLGPDDQPLDRSLVVVPRYMTDEMYRLWGLGAYAAMLAAAPPVKGVELPDAKSMEYEDPYQMIENGSWNAYRAALMEALEKGVK